MLTRILDHFDVMLCSFGHLSAFDWVLAERAMDVTVSAQKRRARVPNDLKICENNIFFCDDATMTD